MDAELVIFAIAAGWAGVNAAHAVRLALVPDRPRAAVVMAGDRLAVLLLGLAVLTARITAEWWPVQYADVAAWLRRIVDVGLLASCLAYTWWRRSV